MIVVVGAGITGLATGCELARSDRDFLVLEASDRPGGVIRSGEVEGRILDWGPQRTRMTLEFRRIVDELDLGDEVLTAPADLPLLVYRAGSLAQVPFSLAELVRSDVVGVSAKLRLVLEPFTAAADPDESVATFFTRKLGREIYENLVGPLFGGLYGSDPADMEVGTSLTDVLANAGIGSSLLVALLRRGGRVAPPPPCSFANGMQALPDALARRLGDRLRLRTPVETIERDGSGWRVKIRGRAEAVDAERVVVTAPAPAAAALLADVAPSSRAAISALRQNSLAIVHLVAEKGLRGLGFQVALSEPDFLLRGVTFNASLFGRDGLHTAFLGGARHPEVATMPDDRLAEIAVSEFGRTTGLEARSIAVGRTSLPAWDTSWRGLRGMSLPDGLHVAGSWWSRPGLPGRFADARRVVDECTTQRAGVRA